MTDLTLLRSGGNLMPILERQLSAIAAYTRIMVALKDDLRLVQR